jgi:hypothetical protein
MPREGEGGGDALARLWRTAVLSWSWPRRDLKDMVGTGASHSFSFRMYVRPERESSGAGEGRSGEGFSVPIGWAGYVRS